ncbi:MAG TPA: hypothetical protein VK470_07805 [Bacteroidota bacterium]|nr:hypothetical protein [Bacteroidota bacterium]
MNVGTSVGSALTQTVNQADAAKQQLGTQSLPHHAYLEKQTQHKVQMILEQIVPKEKPERTVKRETTPKEKRTLRYTVKGKKVTAIPEPNIDTTV